MKQQLPLASRAMPTTSLSLCSLSFTGGNGLDARTPLRANPHATFILRQLDLHHFPDRFLLQFTNHA
jgi:hypothetical protein